MAEWTWEARARTGEVRQGIMEADSAETVHSRLRMQNLNPIQIKKKPRDINIKFGSGVSSKDLVVFTRQFATMIDAGLPIVQCLNILSSQGENKNFNDVLKDVKSRLEGGSTLSEALSKHPAVFDSLFVNLVQAGEIGGILDTILNRLAVYIEKNVKLLRQVRGAMVYPAGVLCIAIAVIIVLLTYVIPSFKKMFMDFGTEDGLPAVTQFVINVSEGFLANALWIFLFAGVFISGLVWSYRVEKGKRIWHKALLSAPIIGPVMRKIAVARFTRTLGTLLGSGVSILEALNIVGKASGNVIIEEAINRTAERIREGRPMAEPLQEQGVFPPLVVQMIAVGEETGALDQMLNKIADFYEEEVDVAVAALTSLLEPIMMVFIGGIVGFILIAMYMPIFDIAGKVKAD